MSEFPVDSLKEAAPHLRRPFTRAAVKFKIQSFAKNGNGLCVAYIDARLVYERLNLICPHLWSETLQPVGSGQMWCHLNVDGVTHSDVGEGNGKGLVSDAIKRAAVHFGVGVSLYAIPQQWLQKGTDLETWDKNGKTQGKITDKGDKRLRDSYEKWLKDHGIQAFGEPLDHGDSEGATGDHEADLVETAPTDAAGTATEVAQGSGADPSSPAPEPISLERYTELIDAAKAAKKKVGDLKLLLTLVGVSVPASATKGDVESLMQGLSAAQADEFQAALA